jgi:hypothetical protein
VPPVAMHFSKVTPNLKAVAVGPASMNPSAKAASSIPPIIRMAWKELKFNAAGAKLISAMYSTMALPLLACAIVSMALSSILKKPKKQKKIITKNPGSKILRFYPEPPAYQGEVFLLPPAFAIFLRRNVNHPKSLHLLSQII